MEVGFRLRRTTLTRVADPADYKMAGGIPVLTPAAVKAMQVPENGNKLEHKDTLLYMFAASEIKLHKQKKLLATVMEQNKIPLTPQQQIDMEDFEEQLYRVKEDRRRANEVMNFEAIKNGITVIKLYTSYLATQYSELMTKP